MENGECTKDGKLKFNGIRGIGGGCESSKSLSQEMREYDRNEKKKKENEKKYYTSTCKKNVLKGLKNRKIKLHQVDKILIDKDIVLEAAKLPNEISQIEVSDVPLHLLDDKDVLLAIFKHDTRLDKLPVKFREHREIVKMYLEAWGNRASLEYASDELKSDRDIVKLSVYKNGLNLKYASDELRSDRDIVISALSSTGQIFKYIPERLREDRDIIKIALRKDVDNFEFLPEKLKEDKDFILEIYEMPRFISCLSLKSPAFRFVSKELRNDKDFVLKILKMTAPGTRILEFVSEELKKDEDIVSLVAQKYASAPKLVEGLSRHELERIDSNKDYEKRRSAGLPCSDREAQWDYEMYAFGTTFTR